MVSSADPAVCKASPYSPSCLMACLGATIAPGAKQNPNGSEDFDTINIWFVFAHMATSFVVNGATTASSRIGRGGICEAVNIGL